MSIFDKMFKKNALDKKMDDAFEYIVENNPVMKKSQATMDKGKNRITHALEKEYYEVTGEHPEKSHAAKGDDDALMKEWDAMFDTIFDGKLSSIKICTACGEAASAKLECCPKCGARLPEVTAKDLMDAEDSPKDED